MRVQQSFGRSAPGETANGDLAVGFPGRYIGCSVPITLFASMFPPQMVGRPSAFDPCRWRLWSLIMVLQPPSVTRVCRRLFICSSIPLISSLGVDRKKNPRYVNIVCVQPLFTLLIGFLTRAPFVVAGKCRKLQSFTRASKEKTSPWNPSQTRSMPLGSS